VVAFGAENSTLEPIARQAARVAGLTLIPDPIPEENLFVRSDQFSFVRHGVPAIFLVPGFTSSDKSVDGQKLFGQFLAAHYHQPSDDLSLPADAPSVERFTRANIALGYLIASEATAPTWKPGNFFGKTFGKGR
jgi:Zn-dependent M28 family amino/carboxypeptidase